jgi:hypothetical protein
LTVCFSDGGHAGAANKALGTAKSGPFNLKIFGTVVAPKEVKEPKPRPKPEQRADAAPSRPDIVEVDIRPMSRSLHVGFSFKRSQLKGLQAVPSTRL